MMSESTDNLVLVLLLVRKLYWNNRSVIRILSNIYDENSFSH